jgi:hypothetical protein
LAKSCHFGRQTTPNDAKNVAALEIDLFISQLTDINWRWKDNANQIALTIRNSPIPNTRQPHYST